MALREYFTDVPQEIVNQIDQRVVQDIPANTTVTQTVNNLHIYADSVTGNDSNNGLSLLTPKKTIEAAVALIPRVIKHDTVVHLNGTFSLSIRILLSSIVDYGVTLMIDGGSEVTTLAGPYTADIHSSTTVGLSSLTMSTDQYKGYWIKILSGPQAGVLMPVFSNTETTFTMIATLTGDPGTCSFSIVKPATTLSSTSTKWLYNACSGGGQVKMQRFTIGNYLYVGNHTASCQWTSLGAMIFEGTTSCGVYSSSPAGKFVLTDSIYLPTNPSTYDSLNWCGITVCSGSISLDAQTYNILYGIIANTITAKGASFDMGYGFRVKKITVQRGYTGVNGGIAKSTGYQTKIDSSPDVGLIIQDGSDVIIAGAVDISSCTSHGIEVNGSTLRFTGIASGTGNGGAGCYAHNGSRVTIANGSAPTLTGTAGNLAVSNPAAQESTWAAIDSGTPVWVDNEGTLAREI